MTFTKELEVVGVGYSVTQEETGGVQTLVFQLGRSHLDRKTVPTGMKASCTKTKVTLTGEDKCQVHTFADEVRRLKKPEPYKGKGILYAGEVVRRKKGKKK